ncbi:hypothetical protein HELRODRAFT_63110 [Helobdella robusta]|uniref:6-phosphofructokinase n=1 Tax=Helobdella robusta TaxID=6412 RepID=T1FXB0_HELRO|nr:hypothetical protein HELRODRAFT_63110 [Helobdella robusta]ESO12363.1 hypothetical protein HELRODRAFT_63110 [Helobdella robusta]
METDVITVEGRKYARGAGKGQSIAILTSGGDAQGMNATVRACLRMAIFLEYKVFLIKEGFQGLITGGDYIFLADWKSVSGILHLGGTSLGSSRSPEFMERSGRLKAAYNLVMLGISNLIAIGGDGTMTGINTLKQEWHLLISELVETSQIIQQKAINVSLLNVVGLVASIDNDFASTDMTIGTDSALSRIVSALDNIQTTATSHQRCFILEVMGRHCGFLGVAAALASEADWLFIPEYPPEKGWEEKMCERLIKMRDSGQRMNLIIVSEGATDKNGRPITPNQIKDAIENVKLDTRITILGHIQRGGHPSAYDRILASRMGAEAVLCLVDYNKDSLPQVIAVEGNSITRISLIDSIAKLRSLKTMMEERDYDRVAVARGQYFVSNFNSYMLMAEVNPPAKVEHFEKSKHYVFGMMCLGPPTCGMNAALRTFVRFVMNAGYSVFAIHHGFEGLMQNHAEVMKWEDVNGWTSDAGTNIGTSRLLCQGHILDKIASQMRKYKLAALLMVGGFEAFYSALVMAEMRHRYLEFCIPICVIPATSANNLPGTDISVGSDTALNEITDICDRIRMSATGSKNKVFLCETMGDKCGYLTTMSSLSTGADASYIFEEAHGIREIMTDLVHTAIKIRNGIHRGLILRSNEAHEHYRLDFLKSLYSHEGRSTFTTKTVSLGEVNEGGRPSAFDRLYSTKLASLASEQLINQLNECVSPTGVVNTLSPETCSLVGFLKRSITFTSIQDLKKQLNFQHRISRDNWWIRLRPLARILSSHDSVYWFDMSEKAKEEERAKVTI